MKERLKEIRKTLGLTQQEFADELGISRNNIASYETGKSNPGDSVILLICRTFNVNENYLRKGEGEMFIQLDRKDQLVLWASEVLNNESESFRKRLIDALKVLDKSEWELLANIAETLVKQKDSKEKIND